MSPLPAVTSRKSGSYPGLSTKGRLAGSLALVACSVALVVGAILASASGAGGGAITTLAVLSPLPLIAIPLLHCFYRRAILDTQKKNAEIQQTLTGTGPAASTTHRAAPAVRQTHNDSASYLEENERKWGAMRINPNNKGIREPITSDSPERPGGLGKPGANLREDFFLQLNGGTAAHTFGLRKRPISNPNDLNRLEQWLQEQIKANGLNRDAFNDCFSALNEKRDQLG